MDVLRQGLTSSALLSPLLLEPLLTVFGSAQVEHKAQLLGSGLLAKGCQPNAQQFVGIFAQNRPEVRLWATLPDVLFFMFNVSFVSVSFMSLQG